MRDFYSDYRATEVIAPKLVSNDATGNGTGTDLLGYEGCLMVCDYGDVGDLHDSSNYVTVKFLASTNNTVFSAIADTDLIGGNNTAVIDANEDANTTVQRGYIGTARYVTISIAVTGTMANGTPAAAFVVKGFAS
jgi:hypothetical protein